MTTIAPVKTGNAHKNLWFDAGDIELKVGDKVIVQTSRGKEFGSVASELFEATDKQLKSLNSELQPVKRVATDSDLKRAEEMKSKGQEGLSKFKEIAAQTNPEMKPVSIEYLFDGRKAVFYFSAPQRQDFRDLVKKLSSEFHIRVDMHQIMDRDKSRIVSGIGICGQELCCARLGNCPKHVSIKMAKVQGLSLSPENISGCCGKLLCCLDYEFEMYDEFSKRAPKLKGKIDTPEGVGVVTDVNMPNETVQIKYGEPEKRVRIPLSYIKAEKKKGMDKNQVLRPNTITKKNWEKVIELNNEITFSASYSSLESVNLQGSEKLSTGEVTKLPSNRRRSVTISSDGNSGKSESRNKKSSNSKNNRRRKPRKFTSNNKHNSSKNSEAYAAVNGATSRRRSRTISTGSSISSSNNSQSSSKPKHAKSNKSNNKPKIRPGQNSSGLQNK